MQREYLPIRKTKGMDRGQVEVTGVRVDNEG